MAERFKASTQAAIPGAVGVRVGRGYAPERLAELGVLQALLDLGAVAVEVLGRGGGLVVDVGEDEAVAVDRGGLATAI